MARCKLQPATGPLRAYSARTLEQKSKADVIRHALRLQEELTHMEHSCWVYQCGAWHCQKCGVIPVGNIRTKCCGNCGRIMDANPSAEEDDAFSSFDFPELLDEEV